MNNKFGYDDSYERWLRGPDREAETLHDYGPGLGQRRVPRGGFSGLGPKGYTRADDRIFEEVCERLSWNDEVDATDISVRVADGEVTLAGFVDTRHMKRVAEQLAEHVLGVKDVLNTVSVRKAVLTELKQKATGGEGAQNADAGAKTSRDG
jgi:BON domain